jgi:hypothetical protein
MKKQTLQIIIASIAVAVVFGCQSAKAQTNTPPTSFFGSVGSYLTSSDTNLPAASSIEVSLGAAYQGGVNVSSDIDLRWKIGGATNTSGFYIESDTDNAGIAGIIVSEEIGGGYFIDKNDIEISAGIRGGYRFDESNGAIGANVRFLKMMTVNTYSGMELAVEFSGDNTAARVPRINLFTGFKF